MAIDPAAVLDSVFEHADFGVAVLDDELRFARVNAALARMNGRAPEELLGRSITEVLPGEVVDACREVLAGGDSVVGVRVEGPDRREETPRTFEASQHPVFSDGAAVGILLTVLEVTVERRRRSRLENELADEHRIATQLQVSLMPDRLPAIPGIDIASGFRPAGDGHEIGGDFYDVFEVSEGCWMAVLGDVCGKGAEAAALTALARYTLRAAALREGAEPATLLAQLNEAILAQHDDMRFLSAVCLFLDLDHEDVVRARVCVAGHLPPMLVHDSGGVEAIAGGAGPVLGVWDKPELTEQQVRFEPGSKLVLYTDGVLDARGATELTETGFAEILGGLAKCDAAATVSGIEDRVAGPGESPKDDMAVLVLRPISRQD